MPPFERLGYISLAKQSVQGTGVVPSKYYKYTKHAFLPQQELEHYRDGYQRDLSFGVKLSYQWRGSFQSFMYADESAAMVAWALGLDTLSGAGDPRTHTITLTDALPYLSAELGFYRQAGGAVNYAQRVIDTKIAGLMLDAEAAKPCYLTADLLGTTIQPSITPTAPTFNDGVDQGPMVFHQGVFTITGPSDASTLQGQIQKIGLELKQNAKPVMANTLVPIAQLEEGRELLLKLKAVFSGASMHALTYFGSAAGTTPSATLGAGAFTAIFTAQASPERSMNWSLPNLDYKVVKDEINPDAALATIDIEARPRRSGSTLPLSVVAKNAVTSAY